MVCTVVRRFIYLLWRPEGRFVYRTREGGGVGGTYNLRCCDRLAVEQTGAACRDVVTCSDACISTCGYSLKALWLIWFTSWIITTRRELAATFLPPNFQVRRRIKVIRGVTRISSSRRPAPLPRHTNHLNPENNKGVRSVPLPCVPERCSTAAQLGWAT